MIYQIVKGAIGSEYWVRARNGGDRTWLYIKSFSSYEQALVEMTRLKGLS